MKTLWTFNYLLKCFQFFVFLQNILSTFKLRTNILLMSILNFDIWICAMSKMLYYIVYEIFFNPEILVLNVPGDIKWYIRTILSNWLKKNVKSILILKLILFFKKCIIQVHILGFIDYFHTKHILLTFKKIEREYL